MAFNGGQCRRMDHHVWQVVPGTNNTVRENVFGGINGICRTRSKENCLPSRSGRMKNGRVGLGPNFSTYSGLGWAGSADGLG